MPGLQEEAQMSDQSEVNELARLRLHLKSLKHQEQWHDGALTKMQEEIRKVKIKILQIESGLQGVLPGMDNDED